MCNKKNQSRIPHVQKKIKKTTLHILNVRKIFVVSQKALSVWVRLLFCKVRAFKTLMMCFSRTFYGIHFYSQLQARNLLTERKPICTKLQKNINA